MEADELQDLMFALGVTLNEAEAEALLKTLDLVRRPHTRFETARLTGV